MELYDTFRVHSASTLAKSANKIYKNFLPTTQYVYHKTHNFEPVVRKTKMLTRTIYRPKKFTHST
jgi:hypothetical protein